MPKGRVRPSRTKTPPLSVRRRSWCKSGNLSSRKARGATACDRAPGPRARPADGAGELRGRVRSRRGNDNPGIGGQSIDDELVALRPRSLSGFSVLVYRQISRSAIDPGRPGTSSASVTPLPPAPHPRRRVPIAAPTTTGPWSCRRCLDAAAGPSKSGALDHSALPFDLKMGNCRTPRFRVAGFKPADGWRVILKMRLGPGRDRRPWPAAK